MMNLQTVLFLKKYAFLHMSSEIDGLSFGNETHLYANETMQIRIVKDKGRLHIEISSLKKVKWRDPFNEVLKINPQYLIKTGSSQEALKLLDAYWFEFSKDTQA